jgi:hypothetical protein
MFLFSLFRVTILPCNTLHLIWGLIPSRLLRSSTIHFLNLSGFYLQPDAKPSDLIVYGLAGRSEEADSQGPWWQGWSRLCAKSRGLQRPAGPPGSSTKPSRWDRSNEINISAGSYRGPWPDGGSSPVSHNCLAEACEGWEISNIRAGPLEIDLISGQGA